MRQSSVLPSDNIRKRYVLVNFCCRCLLQLLRSVVQAVIVIFIAIIKINLVYSFTRGCSPCLLFPIQYVIVSLVFCFISYRRYIAMIAMCQACGEKDNLISLLLKLVEHILNIILIHFRDRYALQYSLFHDILKKTIGFIVSPC